LALTFGHELLLFAKLNQRATLTSFKAALQSVGFDSRLIAESYSFTDFEDQRATVHQVPLAAFSGYPCTYRNACAAVVFGRGADSGDRWVHRHRALGAPLIFEVKDAMVQPWSIAPDKARPDGRPFPLHSLDAAFRSHRAVWNPETLGRLSSASDAKPNRQLDFYDTGLLPVLEQFFQGKLKDLLERAFADTAECFKSVHSKQPAVAFLFPFLFRFVTAKVFMDRADAQGWNNLSTPRQIFDKAEAHSGSGLLNRLPREFLDRRVLAKAWDSISSTLHFQNLSVPDLVGLYEDLFIDEETRRRHGIHSTPVGLAAYIVNHLPWEKLEIDKRVVLEGFSGHGIFLAQAMERMRRDLDPKLTPRQRHQYFQKRLIGVERDPLAVEVCRLLLTLSDYPNDNSWQLHQSDVFEWEDWDQSLKSASVVLANPPYEAFAAEERTRVSAIKAQPPAEFVRRVMSQPPSLLGLVLPQSFLSSPFYQEANRQIAQRYATVSIVELPKLFKYADNETVALLASERREAGKHVSVHYVEVQATRTREFFESGHVSGERAAKLGTNKTTGDFTLWIPPKGSLFGRMVGSPTLRTVAEPHKGVNWIPRKDGLPRTHPRTDTASDIQRKGFLKGAEKMRGNLSQYSIKMFRFLSLLEQHQSPRDKAWMLPWKKRKVVCNAARFERKSPWRLASWADSEGLVFTKQYFAFWPNDGISEYALAAVLSSPFASAFCFERDLGVDNRIFTLSDLPIPAIAQLSISGRLHSQAQRVQELLMLQDFARVKTSEELRECLLRLDAAVLEAYELPAHVQRQLLNQFQNWKRPIAVPFTGYFPEHFKDALTLKDFVTIQYDWDTTNERRCDLIEKELSSQGLTTEERNELQHLQHLADLLVRLKEPYPLEELGTLVAELKANGKWNPST
jgi:hypothetical protein